MVSWRRALGRSGLLRGRRAGLVAVAILVAGSGALVAGLAGSGVLRAVGVLLAVGAPALVALALPALDVAEVRAEHAEQQAATDSERAALTDRVAVLEQVLADATRRPWSPTLVPWHLPELPERPVVLLPGADYHLPELVELAAVLHRRDVPTVIACGRPHWDRTAEGLAAYPDLEVREAPTPAALVDTAAAVVTMKDWAGYGPLVEAANDAGIPTFAKVEGVQDYHDVDTGAELARRPYRTARTILCQGRNDAENLPGDTRIVGSTRLERLWWAPPTRPHRDLVVINLNFTYGVLASERLTFLDSAVEACEIAGRRYVISLHPAEQQRTLHPRSVSVGVSRLLERATLLVTRFSTAGYEALARGVPLAYHNPHGEQVPTFQQPEGAFDRTTTTEELVAVLQRHEEPSAQVRERAATFFGAQVDLDATRASAERGAAVVLDLLGR